MHGFQFVLITGQKGQTSYGLLYGSKDPNPDSILREKYMLIREYLPEENRLTDRFRVVDTAMSKVEYVNIEEHNLSELDLTFEPETITADELKMLWSGVLGWWDQDDAEDMDEDTLKLSRKIQSKLIKALLCFNNPAALARYLSEGVPDNNRFELQPYAQRRATIKIANH